MSAIIEGFLKFVNASPSPFHCVNAAAKLLESNGYKYLNESEINIFSNLKLGGKYYFTRNQSTVFAFAVGMKWKPGNGFTIAAV